MTANANKRKVGVYLPDDTEAQTRITSSRAKFKLVRAGRRGGKTTHGAKKAAKSFLAGRRVFLASPSLNQVDAFWQKLNDYFYHAIEAGAIKANQARRLITYPNNKPGRIECRTARKADELRGGFADDILLDEFAYLNDAEYALHEVIEPMLLDTNGDLEIYSSPRAGSYFNKLDEKIEKGELDEWANFAFTSFDNPHLSREALERLERNAKARGGVRAFEQEILAMRLDEVAGALWKKSFFRYDPPLGEKSFRFLSVVVAVDPAVSSNDDSDETGIVVVAKGSNGLFYVIADYSGVYTPGEWAQKVAWAFDLHRADRVIAEKNNGGDLVKANLKNLSKNMPIVLVWASRGKFARAEPIAALYEGEPAKNILGRVVHAPGLSIDQETGRPYFLKATPQFYELESQQTTWTPDADFSPDRVDALVWGLWYFTQKATGATSF